VAGETYKFRLLNGGSLYALRMSIDGLSMTIVAADSEPVEPYQVDEVILHAAERFDVEVTIPESLVTNSSFWIRADTLESPEQGYQNGVRAILHVVDSMDSVDTLSLKNVADPQEDIVAPVLAIAERHTMNCYSRLESEQAHDGGDCLAVTNLVPSNNLAEESPTAFDTHTVDFDFSAPPGM
jgi:FtsP/CotA-like multicopper oxidase with cupredoxin domain